MAKYYFRRATAEETEAYNKVQDILGRNWVYNEVCDLLKNEEESDLVKNIIRGERLKTIIETYGITTEELCMWYFTTEG